MVQLWYKKLRNGIEQTQLTPKRLIDAALDDAVTRRLVALFKAPPDQHQTISDCVRAAHKGAWKWGKDWRSPSVAAALQFRADTRAWIKSYRALPAQTREEMEALYPAVDHYFDGFANGIDEEMGKRRSKFGPMKPDWTRFDSFVMLMLITAAGGRLSFKEKTASGERKASSALVDLLIAFRPYLPQGFVPEALPVRRLGRVNGYFRKNRR
jgi:hypothetical protein